MLGLSPLEVIVCALLIVVLFGKRLPEVGSGLGKAISNFRKSLKDNSIDVTPANSENIDKSETSSSSSSKKD